MNLKTLDKNNAVHVLNILSIIMAWGVTCFYFEALAPNKAIDLIGNLFISPVHFADNILNYFTSYSLLGNFNLMFLILWLSYALPLMACYPLLMVRNHDASDLREWYLSKRTTTN